MKRALIAGLGILAAIVGVEAANAQAPRPASPGWEWYAAPGPTKRGAMCVTHVDATRGYGFQGPCPAPKAAAAAPKTSKKKKVTSR
jgi:hypothetical protein